MIKIKSQQSKQRVGFKISSFCSVATKEVMKECLLMIKSVRLIYDNNIIIFCDKETCSYIKKSQVKNVECIVSDFVIPDTVVKRNTYHRSDAISLKMDALRYGIEKYGDCLFLDSDIIILKEFSGPSDCEVALSHNLSEHENMSHSITTDGAYNAGMVWSNSIAFADWWKEMYLTRSQKSFYEQSLLNKTHNRFRVSYFDLNHNYGFWRGALGDRKVMSFHCHMDKEFCEKMLDFMKPKVLELRNNIIKYLEFKNPQLFNIYNQIFN